MSPEIMGAQMTPNIRTWDPAQRRVGSLLGLGAAAIVLVVALALWFTIGASDLLYWILVGFLALVLAFVAAVLVLGIMAERKPAPAHDAHVGPSGPPAAEPAPEPARPRVLTLKCGDCATVFDLTDTGERPLYHTCPGCGAEGVLRGESHAPPPPAPVADTMPAPAPRVEDTHTSPPAPVEATAPAPRRLRLRCGGCKEIFVIEDTGERPLRRPCPHCSRMGEIK